MEGHGLVKDSSDGTETMGEVDFNALPVFVVGFRVSVLPATAPGVLQRLPVGCGEAIVVAATRQPAVPQAKASC